MLIDLRKLLSGTEDELTVSACLDMDKFDDGLNSYEIVSKEPFELKIVKVGKSKLHIICSGSVDMNIPCDRCLKPVLTSVSFDIDDTVEMEENASEDEEPEEKDYIDGYSLDVDRLVFGELLLSQEHFRRFSPPQCGVNLPPPHSRQMNTEIPAPHTP